MAPNKKRKKAAANSGRGFATTSIPSKAKSSPHVSISTSPERLAPALDASHLGSSSDEPAQVGETAGPRLQDLSPQELEQHLEEAELQHLIEQYGLKSAKDASRQVVKLEAERRTLRPQAYDLYASRWLPTELVDQIIDFAKSAFPHVQALQAVTNTSDPLIGDDDLCVKLWTLRRVLLQLGFIDTSVREALQHVSNNYRRRIIPGAKDTLWGLEESLDWLTLHADPEDRTSYDTQRIDHAPQGPHDFPAAASLSSRHKPYQQDFSYANFAIDTPGMSPSTSGTATPVNSDHSLPRTILEPGPGTYTARNLRQDIDTHVSSSDDSDEDLEPESLLPDWLSAKQRLYDLQPSMSDTVIARRNGPLATTEPPAADTRGKVRRLQEKIIRIERDILFDRNEAALQWNDKLTQLRKDAAQRKWFHGLLVQPNMAGASSNHAAQAEEANPCSKPEVQDSCDGDEGGLFGALFTRGDSDTPEAGPEAVETEDSPVQVKDFGKWTGISPKRLLEEACKVRYVKSTLANRVPPYSPFLSNAPIHSSLANTRNHIVILLAQCHLGSFRFRLMQIDMVLRSNGQECMLSLQLPHCL